MIWFVETKRVGLINPSPTLLPFSYPRWRILSPRADVRVEATHESILLHLNLYNDSFSATKDSVYIVYDIHARIVEKIHFQHAWFSIQ